MIADESEDLRNTLRRKDEEIRSFRESLSLQQIETNKYLKENEAYEERIVLLEQDLGIAQQAQASLDEQKHQNLMLKETIDRMRFDMDELRAGLASNASSSGSGTSSVPSSVSRSLGAELLSKLTDGGGWLDEEDEGDSAETLRVLGIEGAGDDTEDEDVVQTIITRTKKVGPFMMTNLSLFLTFQQRGLSKANKDQSFTLMENREYADAHTQHDPAFSTKNSTAQTDPAPIILVTSLGTQTDVSLTSASISTQTDIPIPRMTTEVEVQTEEPITSRSPSPQEDDEALASSSSTVLPPTPKPNPTPLDFVTTNPPTDLPPSYNQVTSETPSHDILHLLDTEDLSFSHIPDPGKRRDLRIAVETLRIWHNNLEVPLRSSVEVSADILEEWRALKAEVGIGCRVLDRALEDAAAAAAIKNAAPSSRRRKTGRFYNIYNTYVYGGDGYNGLAGKMPWNGLASHALLCVGASAVVFFVMSPFLAHQYIVPGGPSYYDRSAWSSFNTMHPAGEGFAGEGNIAVWNFLGRLGGGAARIARGWPI